MRVSKEINGKMEEIKLTAKELYAAYYGQEHQFGIEDSRYFVEKKESKNLRNLLDYYYITGCTDKTNYIQLLSGMTSAVRNGINRIGINNVDIPALIEDAFWDTFENMNKLEMPDRSTSIRKMYQYGYCSGDMIPIASEEIALDLYDKGLRLYVLYPDGTDYCIQDKEDIMHRGTADGKGILIGIYKDTWEMYIFKPQIQGTYDQALSAILRNGKKFCSKVLDRLCVNCDYFLNSSDTDEKSLWAENINMQIDMMEDIYTKAFTEDERPQWLINKLTLGQIHKYREAMQEALENRKQEERYTEEGLEPEIE